MLKNYLKIAWRNIIKYKTHSTINIIGLTIGFVGCLLIGLFVLDELKYDRTHPDSDRIYRVFNKRTDSQGSSFLAIVPPTFGPAMQKDFPEVENSLRMMYTYGKRMFSVGDIKYMEGNGFFAEPSIFEFFDLELISGDPAEALSEPNALVITESLAKKYFGQKDALGKTINVDGTDGKISGVIKDVSPHFHLDIDYLISFSTLHSLVSPQRMESWVWQQFFTYLKLTEESTPEQLAAKFPGFVEEYALEKTQSSGFTYLPQLQAVRDIHLYSTHLLWDNAKKGNVTYVIALSMIGLFLLLIACINFINLSTARAERRTIEVAVRKVTGATRQQLLGQFTGETVLLTLISSFLAIQVARILLPFLNNFTGKQLSLAPNNDFGIYLMVLSAGILIGLLAGFYPSWLLSRYRPVEVLKGNRTSGSRQGQWLRKGLVVFQFTLAVLLIIATIVISQQVRYLNEKNYGFDKEQLLVFRMRGKIQSNYENAKNEFLKIPNVIGASAGYGFPGDMIAGDNINKPGEPVSYPANLFTIDHDYISTMGMQLIAGRDFQKERSTDATEAFIINETAVKELGYKNPEAAIGQQLEWPEWEDKDAIKKGSIIGVVKDFHFKPLHEKIGTAVLHIYPSAFWQMALRVSENNLPETISAIKDTWDSFETGYPMEYQFVDESFDAKYKAERKLSTLLHIFCGLTIFVACMGLLGLISFVTEQRTKEIGIRKILGASVSNVVYLITRDFMLLILVALIVASPIAWYLMNRWLENFSYHIEIKWWVFGVTSAAAIFIAFFTIGFQSIKAALSNPVDSLRSE